MYILHLSDLHFGTKNDANRWYNQLARDLHSNGLKCNSLDALVLSGDIASKSTPEEYEAAREFIINLMIDFRLRWPEVVIVPGNHDLNWDLSDDAYQAVKRKDYHDLEDNSHIFDKKEGDYIEVLDPEKYKQRFTYFRDFYKTFLKKPYSLEPEWQYTLHHFPNHDLLILGLNSAWQLDHYYTSRVSINPDALSNAMAEINDNSAYKNSHLKIAVWHHPLNSPDENRIKDHGFIEQLSQNGFRLALHGHIHQANKEDFKDKFEFRPGSKIDIIAAGTFGKLYKRKPASPLQYNLLKWEGKRLTVYTRKRSQPNGAWQPDTMWGHEDKIPASPDLAHLSYYEIDRLFPPYEPDPRLKSHYEEIITAILEGSIVPFLGADINLCDRPSKAKDAKPSDWQVDGFYPPTNLELAAYIDRRTNGENCDLLLRGRCPLISDTSFGGRSKEVPPECPLRTGLVTRLDLQRVSQYFDRNPGQLEDYINTVYNQSSYKPNNLHQFLVRLIEIYKDYPVDTDKPGATPYPLIVTTCFDRTLELAFEEKSQSFDLISYTSSEKKFIHQRFDCQDGGNGGSWTKGEIISDEKKHAAFLQERPVILRLYGPANWESERRGENFAITEDHFLDYFLACDISEKLPTKLWNKLRDSRLWFLGYSLSYWNLRFIIRKILQEIENRYESRKKNIKWWAIQEKPEIFDEEIWTKSHVKFFKAQQIGSLEQYLQQIDRQLRDELEKLPKPPKPAAKR